MAVSYQDYLEEDGRFDCYCQKYGRYYGRYQSK
jgi:hypothetical protein